MGDCKPTPLTDYRWIASDPDLLGGKLTVRGTRFSVSFILSCLAEGMTAAEIENLLYHKSGLKGLSGVSNDMRALEGSDSPSAALAIDYFVYRIALYAGMLAAALAGLDAFIFTAGIGENSTVIRARVAEKLAWLGVDFDPAANASGNSQISRPHSGVALYVIPSDEELMIAKHTLALIRS